MINEKIIENIGIIYLDRPKQINALNTEMFRDIKIILNKWESDDNIKAVLLDSKAEKGFSAGGDLKEVYNDFLHNDECEDKDGYFKIEFDLDKYVNNYPKPIFCRWFGIVMGGGVGLSINSDVIIADETVNWAMPETMLGFTPDVGVCKYISSLPMPLGQYVGLTGASLETSDLIRYKFADIYIDSADYDKVIQKLFELSKSYEANDLIDEFKKEVGEYQKELKETELDRNMEQIEKHLCLKSVDEIFESLASNPDDDFAKETYENLKGRDPFMLKAQFEKYFICKDMTYNQVIDLDLEIMKYARKVDSLHEGIRAKMIDKDNIPSWPVSSIHEVNMDEVKALLAIDTTYEEREGV